MIRLNVSFNVEGKVSVGASNILAVNADKLLGNKRYSEAWEAIFPNSQLREFICILLRNANIFRGRGTGLALPMNFDVLDINSRVTYVVYGSTVKGLLRSAFDNLVMSKAIKRLLDLHELEGTIREIVERENVLNLCPHFRIRRPPENRGGNVEREVNLRICSRYLTLLTPLSCLSCSSPLQCSYPVRLNELRLRKSINNAISNAIAGNALSYLCVDVDGVRHCLPLNRICISCAVFGAPGFKSIVRVSNFVLTCDECHEAIEPRIKVERGSPPRLYQIHFLYNTARARADENPRFIGEIVIDPPRNALTLNMLAKLSYISRASQLLRELVDAELGPEINEDALRELSLSELRSRIATLAKNIVCVSLWAINKGFVRLGRRTSVGYGRIKVICDECEEVWSRLPG